MLPKNFDWEYYISANHDLQKAGIQDETSAIKHWLENGYKENRKYCGSKNTLSLIVACKDRVYNLVEALNSWLEIDRITECIIVDYNSSPSVLENEYFESLKNNSKIKIVRVVNKERFNLGQAYNIAIDYCNNRNILKIDADHICKDSSFLDYFVEPYVHTCFLHGDHIFCDSGLSGFCLFPKEANVYYREDLNAWGHDDLDFYNRLRQKPHPYDPKQKLKEVIFFNIDKYIEHKPHATDTHYYQNKHKNNHLNKSLCLINPYLEPLRQEYKLNNNEEIIFNNKKTIDKIYCINLEHRTDRWQNCNNITNIERFDAVNTSDVTDQYIQNGLTYKPIDTEVAIYFYVHSGAYGAYLSHYLLWQKIVASDVDYALVLEDDIELSSVTNFLDSNLLIEEYDFIQLSKKIRFDIYNNAIFDGAESYIISNKGANTLLSLTHSPFLFDKLGVNKYNNANYVDSVSNNYRWSEQPAITCPVDKFMGYACQTGLLKFFLYPTINIDKELSKKSNIAIEGSINAWNFDYNTIKHYSKLIGNINE